MRSLGDELMNTIAPFAAISLVAMIVVGVTVTIVPTISAQENLTPSQPQDSTRNASAQEKLTF